jgi:RNA polymerase sigma factor (sigma-70 family)
VIFGARTCYTREMPPPAEGFAARIVLGPALRTQPDKRLVALVREGYETAFEEIVRRYDKALGRYAAAIVGGRSEDVTQDAFSKALLALRRDDSEIELRPWLYRIVRNTALNDLRDRPAAAEELAEAIAGGRNPAEELEQREELADLMKRLRALPESQRAAIVMRELEGLSHEEIAAALGLSGGGARQAIHRARTALRDGAGLLLPLPLVRFLIDHGADVATAGAGAGTAVAGGTAGGVGAGTLIKAGVVTAVLAGSVGTGVALRETRAPDTPSAAAASSAEGTTGGSSNTGSVSLPASGVEVAAGASIGDGRDGDEGNSGHGREGIAEVDRGPALAEGGRHSDGPEGPPRTGRHGPRGPVGAGGPGGPHPIRHGGNGPHSGPGSHSAPPGDRHGGGEGGLGAPGSGGHRGPGGAGRPGDGSLPPPPLPPTDGGTDDGEGGSGSTSSSGPSKDRDDLP